MTLPEYEYRRTEFDDHGDPGTIELPDEAIGVTITEQGRSLVVSYLVPVEHEHDIDGEVGMDMAVTHASTLATLKNDLQDLADALEDSDASAQACARMLRAVLEDA